MEHDLVDELTLMVFPIVVGKGKRLLGKTEGTKATELVEGQQSSPLDARALVVLAR